MTTLPAFKETDIECAEGVVTMRQMGSGYSSNTISFPIELWGNIYDVVVNEIEIYLRKIDKEVQITPEEI